MAVTRTSMKKPSKTRQSTKKASKPRPVAGKKGAKSTKFLPTIAEEGNGGNESQVKGKGKGKAKANNPKPKPKLKSNGKEKGRTLAESQPQPFVTPPQTSGDVILYRDPKARVDGMLYELVEYLGKFAQELPVEAKRLKSCQDERDMLITLDLLVRDHVLDDYLRQHPVALLGIQEVFACRYPWLRHPDFRDEEAENNATAYQRQHGHDRMFESQVKPFFEAFRPSNLDPKASKGEVFNINELSWVADYSTHPLPESERLVPASVVNNCLDAYDNYQPLPAYQEWAHSQNTADVSRPELDIAQTIYELDRTMAPPPTDKLQEIIGTMPIDIRHRLYPGVSDKDILLDLGTRVKRTEIISRLMTDASIELQLEFSCPTPAPEEMALTTVGVTLREAHMALRNVKPLEIDSTLLTGRVPYKGHMILRPQVLLQYAKNFLSDEDTDRIPGWKNKYAEVLEYATYLAHQYVGQGWREDLADVLDLLNTHRIFEKYHYGPPRLIVDFPMNVWPKESMRLPRLPGPDVELRRESDDQRDLKGPRLLLHLDVVSTHDQQYEMPIDVLKGSYLKAYWEDAPKFWAGNQTSSKEPINFVEHENKHYEACMEGGMVRTAKFLNGKSRFRYSLEDLVECPGKTIKAKRESLEAFGSFRGGKRAALQQCLNMFDSSENRRMCTPWRTLTLPAPRRKQKPDAGIIFPSISLEKPPSEKAARDPWAYTRAHQRYRKEEKQWAAWTREHTIKIAWKHKLAQITDDGPIMELPKTWKGLYPPDVMDVEMKRRYELLRRCQVIRQSLKRAATRAPREFINDLMKMLDAGLSGKDWNDLGLDFGKYEFSTEYKGDLALIRPTEAAWLEYICQPSRNRPIELSQPIGRIGVILVSRVVSMLSDISPISLFRDMEPRSVSEFLKEVNSVCGGPVKRHRFTRQDVLRLAPALHALRVLQVYRQEDGELMLGRPDTEFHPEDLIVWPKEGEDRSRALEGNESASGKGKSKADSASVVTSSTDLTIPASIDDFLEYPDELPKREDVLSLEDYVENPNADPADKKRTKNFFQCLGYRLGLSLLGLKVLYEEDLRIIKDPELRQRNAEFLRSMIDMWTNDTKTRPNNPHKNPRKTTPCRETLTMADVVKMADPESHRPEWATEEWPDETVARDVVRRNLVRELYENKTMLWPVQLPYDRKVREYKVADPFAIGQEVMVPSRQQEETPKPTLRREPVWTFGHPSRKLPAHLFWDVNNWPHSVQSRDLRERVRSRGPDKQRLATAVLEGAAKDLVPMQAPREMSFWQKASERREYMEGLDEYWVGDTPLQRKVFENRIRNEFESTPRKRKRDWSKHLSSFIFGENTTNPTDEDLILPEINPGSIPKSSPFKKPRLSEPLEDAHGNRFVFKGDPQARMEGGVTIMSADNEILRVGSLLSRKVRRLVEKLKIDTRKASITYYIPETMAGHVEGDDIPLIIYYRPDEMLEYGDELEE